MDKNFNNRPRVLIAEDDLVYQRLLERYIQRAGGSCECSSDGRTALQKATENHYDLLLIDMHIPSLDGIMLVKLLRERGCAIPSIAITALEIDNLEQNALTVGFNEFFQKPITETDISSLFKRYCRA
jgi:CheY-like chemotaxis protein